ncbi:MULTISPECIES: hypothetical protein [unclassified Aliiroseovarius]|uniref:hypothetical protein n=1 Tax=unclassified Aliiroseovarius TaxID=2623558 RepID=UPI001569928B|nr:MULTISPECIES: hypothetical protein [unclassified Aliiroseovarius]NRP30872.1 hypothetical protein [Aliiroseovarius sp. xm-m-314]NRP80514.1 hypothetical protein [Aliiroseovarius sp. xm-v-209]
MQFRNINALAGYSAALDALTARQRAALEEIVFCFRLGSLSVTAVFGDIEVLRDVAGQVPAEIERAVTRRYGVDLESLSYGQRARFYVDGDEPETVLLGFTYSAVGELEEWKRYRRDAYCKQCLLIDRFDAANEAKSIGDVERAGGPDLWNGPRDLPIKAIKAGLHVIYLAKVAKNQSYLRILSG